MLKRATVPAAALAALAIAALVAPATGDAPRYQFRTDLTPGRTVSRDYLHSGLRLSGSLVDGFGEAAPGVLVVAFSSPLDASGFAPVAGAITDSRGHYSITVPVGGPRILKVEAGGTTDVMVRERVAPSVWIRVASRRHRTLAVFGRIWAPGIAPTVVLMDRTPTAWATFAVTYPAVSGRFRIVYHGSPRTAGLRLKLRATTFPLAGWRSGASAVRTATVRR